MRDEILEMDLHRQDQHTQTLLLGLAQHIEVVVAAEALVEILVEICEGAEAGTSMVMIAIDMTREIVYLIVLIGHEVAHGIQYDGNGMFEKFEMIESLTDVTAMTGDSGLVMILMWDLQVRSSLVCEPWTPIVEVVRPMHVTFQQHRQGPQRRTYRTIRLWGTGWDRHLTRTLDALPLQWSL